MSLEFGVGLLTSHEVDTRLNIEFQPFYHFLSRFAVCDQTVFNLLKGPKAQRRPQTPLLVTLVTHMQHILIAYF